MARPKIIRTREELDSIPNGPVQVEFSDGGNTARVTLTAIDRKVALESGLDPIALAGSRLYPGSWKSSALKKHIAKKQITRAQAKRALKLIAAWINGGGGDST